MSLRQLPLVTHRNISRKWEALVSMALYSVMVCCATHVVGMKSVWSSLRMQGYRQTCSSSSMMTLVVGILAYITWLLPYLNDIGKKYCMLILKYSK